MSQGRVPTSDLHTEQLRTIAYSGDTFVQGPRVQEDDRTNQIVQALGHFNQNLGRVAANMGAQRQKKDAEAAQRQANAIMMESPEGRAEIARSGMIDGVPIKDAAVLRMAGSNVGTTFQETVQQSFAGRDLTGVDVDAEIDKLAAPNLKEYGGNTFVLGGFMPQVEQAKAWARNLRSSQTVATRKQAVEGTVFETMSNQVDRMVSSGASPDDMRKGMQELYSFVAAGQSAVADPDLLDQYRTAKAQQLVATNPQAAIALLDLDITGTDGRSRPHLATDPRFSNQVFSIGQQAKGVMAKQETAQAFTTRRQENLQRVTVGNDYRAFDDLQVNGQKLTAEEQKVQLLADVNASVDREIAAGRATEMTKRQTVRTITSRLGIDDPFVKGELDGIERRYSTLDVANNPDQLRDIESRVAAWKEYDGASRNALNAQLSDKSKRFYTAFDSYKRYVSDSSDGALEFANQVTNPPEGWERSLSGRQMDDLDSSIQSKLSGPGWKLGLGGESSIYSQMYFGEVRRMSTLFMSAGMDTKKAVEAATESVFANRVHYHGDPLIGLEKQRLPEDYQAVLDKFATYYKTMDARGKTYEGTPTFFHTSGGVIAMRDRDTNAILEDETGKMIVFDVQHLRDVSAGMEKEKRDTFIRDAATENARQRDQLETSPGMTRKRTVLDWIKGAN